MGQDSVAVKHMEDWTVFLKRLSDDGRHMQIPGLSAGACYELAVELEVFIDSYKQKKWNGLTEKERQEIYENNESWWEQSLRTEAKLKEKNEGTIR